MSDFLARLAQRATDTAAVVRPRPLGRFEPATQAPAAADFDVSETTVERPSVPPAWPATTPAGPPPPPAQPPGSTAPRPRSGPMDAPPAVVAPRPPATPSDAPRPPAPAAPGPPLAADAQPSRRRRSAPPPTPPDEASTAPTPGPSTAADAPRPATHPPAISRYVLSLLPRAARVAPPADADSATPSPSGRGLGRGAADSATPSPSGRGLGRGVADSAAPSPFGRGLGRGVATPELVTQPSSLIPHPLLAQLRAALRPGPDERPLPTAQPPAPPPVVHIHIGRVEVRAAPPPARPAALARPAPPLQTLDDYLRRRNGERP